MSYSRFAVMIVTSTIVMYGLMYLSAFSVDHVLFSQTRLWMALLMGAVMTIIMLIFMWPMYERRRLNIAIITTCIAIFAGALWLVRSQSTVGDVAYMEAMIPNHSIAIMTSERAKIRDPRVRALADGIANTQVREIAEMEVLIADLKAHPAPRTTPLLKAAIPDQRETISSAK